MPGFTTMHYVYVCIPTHTVTHNTTHTHTHTNTHTHARIADKRNFKKNKLHAGQRPARTRFKNI